MASRASEPFSLGIEVTTDHEILERLRRAFDGGEMLGPVAEELIAAAEVEIGLRFPRSYRLFLKNFGAVHFAYDIAGLPVTRYTDAEPPYWSNVLDDTLRCRRASRGLIPHSYIPVSADGGDFVFYFETASPSDDGECPVVVLGPGKDGIQVASSFVEFIEKALACNLFPAEAE